jgi:hypothetical protein
LIRRSVIILILVALGVQTLPVRVCAVEQAVTGSSCHDLPSAEGAFSSFADPRFDGHVRSDGQHEPECQCGGPKGELDRHVPFQTQGDHFPPVEAHPDLQRIIIDHPLLTAAVPPPDAAAAAVTLPLLN